MQLSLRDLFAIIAFTAVICWCGATVGLSNAVLFLVVLGISAGYAALFVWARRARLLLWIVPMVLFVFLITTVFSLALLLQGVVLVVASLLGLVNRDSTRKQRAYVAMASMACGFAAAALFGMAQTRELNAMRQEFPIVSLASRLSYEQGNGRAAAQAVPLLSGDVDAALTQRQSNRFTYRHRSLKQIHSESYEGFVRAMGFGVGRMSTPRSEYLRLPPLRNIAFHERGRETSNSDAAESRWEWDERFTSAGGNVDSPPKLHQLNRQDFLDPESFGATFGDKQAAGFVEHALHYPATAGLANEEAWQVERLELVSLLKFEEPRVYVLDHLPRMDQLTGDDVPTRPLDDFERESLERLHTEQDIAVAEQEGVTRMLGSLRAADQCLDCHTAVRGELLGAFSYVLRGGNSADQLTAAAER